MSGFEFDRTPLHPGREIEKGQRLLVRMAEGDTMFIVDDVSEPDADGTVTVTGHPEDPAAQLAPARVPSEEG